MGFKAEICRENDIADSLLRKWRDQLLAAGAERLSAIQERTELDELRSKVSQLERALGRKDDGGGGRGRTLAGMGASRKADPPPWSPVNEEEGALGYRPVISIWPPGGTSSSGARR